MMTPLCLPYAGTAPGLARRRAPAVPGYLKPAYECSLTCWPGLAASGPSGARTGTSTRRRFLIQGAEIRKFERFSAVYSAVLLNAKVVHWIFARTGFRFMYPENSAIASSPRFLRDG
jgi:hypothetical protein